MLRRKAKKSTGVPPRVPFVPCNRNGCMSGMVRVIRDGVSSMRNCSCLEAWKASRSLPSGPIPSDGKSAAANA